MLDYQSENNRSHYGIEKLQDHTYHTWSFQCQMLLSEKKVWKVVNGEITRPPTVEESHTEEERKTLSAAARNKIQKEIDEWNETDEEALRIITFTVSDPLQGPIRYGKTAKGAWDELQKVHAPNDKQCKFSLLRRLYRLDMSANRSLIDHESRHGFEARRGGSGSSSKPSRRGWVRLEAVILRQGLLRSHPRLGGFEDDANPPSPRQIFGDLTSPRK